MKSEPILMNEGEVDNSDQNSNDYEILFSYWNELPNILMIDAKRYFLSREHGYRDAILTVLRRGIIDEQRDKRRHVLSMKEIQEEVKNELSVDKIPKSTLYHHRDVLLDLELITEVETFLEGKRYVTYYSRVAKAFIGEDYTNKKKKEYINDILKILKSFNPGTHEKEFEELLDEMRVQFDIRHEKTLEWLEDHAEIIQKNDIDVIFLYKLVSDNMELKANNKDFRQMIRKYLDIKD